MLIRPENGDVRQSVQTLRPVTEKSYALSLDRDDILNFSSDTSVTSEVHLQHTFPRAAILKTNGQISMKITVDSHAIQC